MELIYSYLHSCWGESFTLGLNFSQKLHCEYDFAAKKIVIQAKKETRISDFFGSNISNVTAIVGRNGVGKSTILHLLGLKKRDLSDIYRTDEAVWFCLYHIEGKYYAVEGISSGELFDDCILQRRKGYFAYILVERDGQLSYESHLQDYSSDFENTAIILFNPRTKVRERYELEYNNYGFKRGYINNSTRATFEFLTFQTGFPEFQNRTWYYELKINNTFRNNKIASEKSLRLFQHKSFYTEEEFPLPFTNYPEKLNGNKEHFILHLMEMLINEHFIYAVEPGRSEFLDEQVDQHLVERYLGEIGELFDGDLKNFSQVRNYLSKILLRFIDVTKDLIGTDEDINWITVVKVLESLPKEWFKNSEGYIHLVIPCTPEASRYDVVSMLDELAKTYIVSPVRSTAPLMSSGQKALVEKISSIRYAISNHLSDNRVKSIILLLDEYEEHLHPEWSRRFFDYLLTMLNQFNKSVTIQVVIATHAPYIISDLPKENIIKLEWKNYARVTENCHFGFGSNIFDIICDSFFLDNSLGAFARKKIDYVIETLASEEPQGPEQLTECLRIIELVDDPYLQSKLQQLLDVKYPQRQREKEIERLKKRIIELERSNSND
ncbi:AAA family ATPase [Enterobacter kobei]|uniref:AAA family ATPase n=1 Tax=Enterobacter kobei TaxID=208224 RepID=UPI0018C1DE71|nr:AAA family ATPase [Enterobacter kobei]MBG0579672.1 AAA family ATPase [Enterobacter kobei]MEB6644466.1 AAA family ATPase [Enterobacter kobei]UXJ62671.1 AAA family ATPase [Enterobacter kobei]